MRHRKNQIEKSQGTILQVIDVLRNKMREKGQPRLHVEVKKNSNDELLSFLNDQSISKIYHCELKNNHCVALCGEWIFDPVLNYAIPRTLSSMMWCAQCDNTEQIPSIIQKVYSYTCDLQKRIKY